MLYSNKKTENQRQIQDKSFDKKDHSHEGMKLDKTIHPKQAIGLIKSKGCYTNRSEIKQDAPAKMKEMAQVKMDDRIELLKQSSHLRVYSLRDVKIEKSMPEVNSEEIVWRI